MDNPPVPDNPEPERRLSKLSTGPRRGSAAPLWLWALLVGGFSFIFWEFRPEWTPEVDYQPWFLDQVERDNVRSLAIRNTAIRGELREPQRFQSRSSRNAVIVGNFITYFPSEQSIEPVISLLREKSRTTQPVLIETGPGSPDPGSIRSILMFQTILIMVLIVLVWTLRTPVRSDQSSSS